MIHGSGVSGRVITYSRRSSSKCPKRIGSLLLDAGHDDAAHECPLGEEEHDHRDGHGHQCGGLDERGLRNVQGVVLLDGDRQRLQLRLPGQVEQRQEVLGGRDGEVVVAVPVEPPDLEDAEDDLEDVRVEEVLGDFAIAFSPSVPVKDPLAP